MIVVPAPALHAYLEAIFKGWGTPGPEARHVADHLVAASLDGHDSHGPLRAPWYLEKIAEGALKPDARVGVVRSSSVTAVVDGGWGFGQPASKFAMELAMEKAGEHGMATVVVRNAGHMGRVGYYTRMAADAGLIALGCVNLNGALPCVAPFGGIDRRLGTNPFSVAFPTDRDLPFVADLTTSVVAEGKVQFRRNNGSSTPDGWLVGHDGQPTTDPWTFYRDPVSALLPLGGEVGHKGFALSMAVEALAGGLSGGVCADGGQHPFGNCCWYTVYSIEAFVDADEFRANVGRMIDYVKASRRAKGVSEILYPGEPEQAVRAQRSKDGVPVDPATWSALGERAAAVGVSWETVTA